MRYQYILALLGPLALAPALCSATPRTQALASAIAKAEGFGIKNAVPTRTHNPGDIRASKSAHYPGQIGLNSQHYVIFKNDAAGWAVLNQQLEKIAQRESKYYSPEMTLLQLSKKYATSPTWIKNVSKNLGVTPTTTLAVILDVPPAFNPAWKGQHEAGLDFLGSRPVARATTKTQRTSRIRAGAVDKEPTAYDSRTAVPWMVVGVEGTER